LTLLSYQAMRFQEKVVSPERQSACMSALQVGSSSVKEDDGAILLYTSGTTGTPKGVQLTHRQVMATARNVGLSHELTDRDVCYSFLPLFHINAQVIGLLTTLTTGGQLVLDSKFSASRFWPTIAKYKVTWVSAVPTVIAILIKSAGEPVSEHRPRFVRSASAPLPDLHARRFEARFSIPLIESYGMTEAASQICINPLPPALHKFGSAGRPFGLELRIVDDEGATLPQYDVGEIVIRGDSVISTYESGDTSGKSFRDGWFYTGDLGYRDVDGFVFITGRSKEMINRAGQKISPREVEEVVLKDPRVKSAAVIGLPDDLYGERVVAYVIPDSVARKGDANFKGELHELCRQSISAYKCPSEFHIVDEIPLGPTGKIQRHRLREQAVALGHAAVRV
ncbi:MAG: AMP-binding protein, partial [Firmicutes bacterium]|nr:AMP-binding protein [Bacillota bacterium]